MSTAQVTDRRELYKAVDAAKLRLGKMTSTPLRAHAIEFRVRYAETDQMQVVYHSNYLIWCEMGRTEFIRAVGTPYAELERQNVTLAVVEASMRFHSAARYDNLIRVTTTVREVRSRTITFDYVITNAETGERFVTASTKLASLTRDNRLTTLPDYLRKLLEDAVTTSAR